MVRQAHHPEQVEGQITMTKIQNPKQVQDREERAFHFHFNF